MARDRWLNLSEAVLFQHRPLVVGTFLVVSLALLLSAARLEIDAGFAKHLPTDPPFMQVYEQHQADFGGAH
ncbi:MAG: hypothetical protein F4Y53_04805, partial [Proteobacteria bacterium]|nr:hypothetical protein [Pseudomonadota bacterium]